MTAHPVPDEPRILVLDFGSQYTMLIARRIRELQVYCEIHPYNTPLADIEAFGAAGLILSGGPASCVADDAPHADPGVFDLGVPTLGICYGAQDMTRHFGGDVQASDKREYGPARIIANAFAGPLAALDDNTPEAVWMSHGDRIEAPAPGFEVIAHSEDGVVAAVADVTHHRYGVQFHPEVVHTPRGREMLSAFVIDICGCRPTWTPEHIVDVLVRQIREQVGEDGRVLCGLSGGVDSSVAAALVHRAIGDRLTCVFVDNGLLRKGEAHQVEHVLGRELGLPIVVADAKQQFLDALAGVDDPEKKRKIIGHVFIEVFEESAKNSGEQFDYLCQGTLYPDVIESVSFKGPSATIKSHHNVGGLPDWMRMELVEPLRELFKDEVRVIGRTLGLPSAVVDRQPFPGPGLAIRILSDITDERLRLVREADAVVREEFEAWPGHKALWQYFAVLLPVRSVGVMGDQRTYEATCAIRCVTSVDGMTADWPDLPRDLLARTSTRIINEVRGINRVVYDITSKPPGTIEWE